MCKIKISLHNIYKHFEKNRVYLKKIFYRKSVLKQRECFSGIRDFTVSRRELSQNTSDYILRRYDRQLVEADSERNCSM